MVEQPVRAFEILEVHPRNLVLDGEDLLLRRIGDVHRAVCSGGDIVEPLCARHGNALYDCALVDIDHDNELQIGDEQLIADKRHALGSAQPCHPVDTLDFAVHAALPDHSHPVPHSTLSISPSMLSFPIDPCLSSPHGSPSMFET